MYFLNVVFTKKIKRILCTTKYNLYKLKICVYKKGAF